MKTLDQEMASKVYKKVKDRESTPDAKKYGAMAHKLPILVRTAGLAEALAFVESRGSDSHKELLNDLAQVVMDKGGAAFAAKSREADMQEYIYLTRRTMLALKWFKRFAQSVLKVEPTQDEGIKQ